MVAIEGGNVNCLFLVVDELLGFTNPEFTQWILSYRLLSLIAECSDEQGLMRVLERIAPSIPRDEEILTSNLLQLLALDQAVITPLPHVLFAKGYRLFYNQLFNVFLRKDYYAPEAYGVVLQEIMEMRVVKFGIKYEGVVEN